MNGTDTKETDLALGDAEIASIIAVSRKAIYQKSQKAPTRDTKNFNPRKLVDLAFEAETKRTASKSNDPSDEVIKADVSDNINNDLGNENALSNVPPEPKDEEITKLEDQIKKLSSKKPSMIWIESPTNPLLKILDIRRICMIARKRN